MKMIAILYLLLFTAFTPPPDPPAITKLHYILKQEGRKVGDIYATRSGEETQQTYDVETKMQVKILVKQDISYSSKAVFSGGILQNSIARSYINQKLHHSVTTTWKGSLYEILVTKKEKEKEKDTDVLKRKVSYSGTMLYFKEPVAVGRIYSEMSGQDNLLQKTGEHEYTLTDVKTNKKNKYWYRNGVLDHAFINHTLIDLELRKAN
jgi:hypothetical protein